MNVCICPESAAGRLWKAVYLSSSCTWTILPYYPWTTRMVYEARMPWVDVLKHSKLCFNNLTVSLENAMVFYDCLNEFHCFTQTMVQYWLRIRRATLCSGLQGLDGGNVLLICYSFPKPSPPVHVLESSHVRLMMRIGYFILPSDKVSW